MTRARPLSSGSPRIPVLIADQAVDDALAIARKALHVTDPRLPLIGFTNGISSYQNACFRNALFSLLVNLRPFSGWIVSNSQGQLDSSPTAHLVENVIREYFATDLVFKQARADKAAQRLYNYVNVARPIDTRNIRHRYPQNSQQDATEVLSYLLSDIGDELRASQNIAAAESFAAIHETELIAQINCQRCGKATHREPANQDQSRTPLIRSSLTVGTTSFADLIQRSFAEGVTPAKCRKCKGIQPRRGEWKIVKAPEVLFIDVDQIDPLANPLKPSKPGHKVPDLPEHLVLTAHLHPDAAATGITAEYRLSGVINHHGVNPNLGHYTSHVRHTQPHNSGDWYLINDATVSASSLANLQRYNPARRANQMLPRLIAYVKVHPDEDERAIRTRTAKPQLAPRGFLHPQIVFFDDLTLGQLRQLCRSQGLPPGNTKTIQSLTTVINKANSAQSTFATRLKDWLMITLLSTGAYPDALGTKAQLAARLKDFMSTQPARTQIQQPITRRQLPLSDRKFPTTGDDKSAVTQADLDAANALLATTQAALEVAIARIAEQAQTIADYRINDRLARDRQITTNQVRELTRRLEVGPGTRRGTKRQIDDDPDAAPEAKKCRVRQNYEEIYAGIDAAANQQSHGSSGKNYNGTDDHANNGSPGSNDTGGRDSDEENQPPEIIITQKTAIPEHNRCHLCPQFPNEIHHMHENVCGCSTGLYSLSASEQAEEDRELMRRFGAVRYRRFGPPMRGPPYPPPLWDVIAWDFIIDENNPQQMHMRPVRVNAAGNQDPMTDGLPPTASMPHEIAHINPAGFQGYIATPHQTRRRLATPDGEGQILFQTRPNQFVPCSPGSSPVTFYDTTSQGDHSTLGISPTTPGESGPPSLPSTPATIRMTMVPPIITQENATYVDSQHGVPEDGDNTHDFLSAGNDLLEDDDGTHDFLSGSEDLLEDGNDITGF